MPLSEHEQRLLDQIERQLYAEDPKFANAVRSTSPQVHYKRRVVKAALGFMVGICLLMGGVIFSQTVLWQTIVGVLGFLVMLACTLWGLSGLKRISSGAGSEAEAADSGGKPQAKRQQKRGMMDRLEERWRKRQEGDDR
ncbi:DUF3040 domain-containing protein [Allonocardiopsis opalescens]|uniref:DUF3040 family protein n=1 Tax=Allonocardiopsis opalescens TaxID=1144618 RepID=A0A2T0Q3U5_9ACTN|nr:DUF3040 domain-containing protein [Allonocardiopsis opalescens]PRX98474.1 Protein of unknown function (DUF3040) [Allonocardiopsis opalescens]